MYSNYGRDTHKILIDHKNMNTFDNTEKNLRFCDKHHNQQNIKISSRNTSGAKGVNKNRHGKWQVRIAVKGKRINLGIYDCIVEAAEAYNEAAKKYHGEFARLNSIYKLKKKYNK